MLAELCKGSDELALAEGLNGFCEDRFRIVVVENHDVLGAVSGGVQEPTGMVAKKSAGNRHRFGKRPMGLDVGIGRDGRHLHDVWWRNGG